MAFIEEDIYEIINEVTSFQDINLSDIPDIDLYMDQVITLFEMKLNNLKRNKDEKVMTKTMINNYAKAKILPPVKGKKYNKEQIILLNLIYNLKQNLSLADISAVFNHISKISQKEEDKLSAVENLYQSFLEIKESQEKVAQEQLNELVHIIKEKGNNLKEDEGYSELILLVLTLINRANIEKRLAEKIIDKFF
ncbi:DUF1836 domain-containing protein [uncultured Clostridium sp.]|uniref:DUF1836 domain-containing protein n=1 Tax=uncultured Clostridium sp. TaxID=59620 RepID=UPI0028ECBCB8|nr:DUF1836 domain-containing protein [uncultured Clostridium sp.]